MSLKDYNSQLEPIILKEYGRNVQKIVQKIIAEPDNEVRLKLGHSLVGLMKQLAPSQKDNQETVQKIWNHLHIIADFQLNLENPPYPIPSPDLFTAKPKKVPYHDTKLSMRQYGKNIELLVQKAIDIEDEEEKENTVIYLGRLIKRFHHAWNPDSIIEDELIIEQIKRLSKGKLTVDLEKVKSGNLFYSKPTSYTNYQTSNFSTNSKRSNTGRSFKPSSNSSRSSDRRFDKKRRVSNR